MSVIVIGATPSPMHLESALRCLKVAWHKHRLIFLGERQVAKELFEQVALAQPDVAGNLSDGASHIAVQEALKRGDPQEINAIRGRFELCALLRNLSVIPAAPARTVELVGGHVALFAHQERDYDHDDTTNAQVLVTPAASTYVKSDGNTLRVGVCAPGGKKTSQAGTTLSNDEKPLDSAATVVTEMPSFDEVAPDGAALEDSGVLRLVPGRGRTLSAVFLSTVGEEIERFEYTPSGPRVSVST